MEIQHQRSKFSQFSDDLWLSVSDGDTTIKFDVDQGELLEFATHLLDVADDCLRKSKKDTDDLQDRLTDLMNDIHTREHQAHGRLKAVTCSD